jgi:glycyl-tRNA synthetase alpha subunit
MKKYTLEIIYDEITGELESLKEFITEKESVLAITASEEIMEKITKADLIESLLVPCPGECVGET